MLNVENLVEKDKKGMLPAMILFWGDTGNRRQIDKSCLSQWFESSFTKGDLFFRTAEHYMMYYKALTFNNKEIAKKILESSHPAEAKKLGREVKNYDNSIWSKLRYKVVVEGNKLKFTQHQLLYEYLLFTDPMILVEASPFDKIWGIGLDESDNRCLYPEKWKGLNLLGFALMEVRTYLKNRNKLMS